MWNRRKTCTDNRTAILSKPTEKITSYSVTSLSQLINAEMHRTLCPQRYPLLPPITLFPRYFSLTVHKVVRTQVSMKTTVFWNTAPCRLAEVDRRFRDAYLLHRPETSVSFYETTGHYPSGLPPHCSYSESQRDGPDSFSRITESGWSGGQ
jgi:hypothetical protein